VALAELRREELLALIPMSVQDETKARRILALWQGASEAHIRPDLSG
jgi:hypothetical protein